MQELAVCTDPAMMDSLRVLLIAGACLIVGFFIAEQAQVNLERLRRPKATVSEECKLHGRKLKDCPPGSHEQNSDDSSSQEPPTDDSGANDGRGESALPDE